jgi:predicted GNAT superfamily acetyltransferase
MPNFNIRLIETPEEMPLVEELQRDVWPGSETDVVPLHMLITAVHNGGLVLGAFVEEKMIGFVFGFPGIENTPDGPRPKHCSHMMGIHPDFRDSGVGFALKRAQWQMVRHQNLDHITWTYDPLLSRNAYLNIAKLGAVCTTYHRSEYGDMRDGLNAGLPSDRFQVDWWINTLRVESRLSMFHPLKTACCLLKSQLTSKLSNQQTSLSPVTGAFSPVNFLKPHLKKNTSSLISSLMQTKGIRATCIFLLTAKARWMNLNKLFIH